MNTQLHFMFLSFCCWENATEVHLKSVFLFPQHSDKFLKHNEVKFVSPSSTRILIHSNFLFLAVCCSLLFFSIVNWHQKWPQRKQLSVTNIFPMISKLLFKLNNINVLQWVSTGFCPWEVPISCSKYAAKSSQSAQCHQIRPSFLPFLLCPSFLSLSPSCNPILVWQERIVQKWPRSWTKPAVARNCWNIKGIASSLT